MADNLPRAVSGLSDRLEVLAQSRLRPFGREIEEILPRIGRRFPPTHFAFETTFSVDGKVQEMTTLELIAASTSRLPPRLPVRGRQH
jgi:hypothetical protein